jgi:hypothetical protein
MMPTRLSNTMRDEEKKYIMNSRGFLREKAPISISIPKTRKKSDTRAIKIFFPHQRREPIRNHLLTREKYIISRSFVKLLKGSCQ